MNTLIRPRRANLHKPKIEPFGIQRHPRFVKRVNAIVALVGLCFALWLGYEIARGYRLGNPAFRMAYEKIGESLAGGVK